jgi:hypothetical protein
MAGNFGSWSLGSPSPLVLASLPPSVGLPLSSYSAVVVGGILVITGFGSPVNSCPAPQGSLFLRSDGSVGSTIYAKESGADPSDTGGWAAK